MELDCRRPERSTSGARGDLATPYFDIPGQKSKPQDLLAKCVLDNTSGYKFWTTHCFVRVRRLPPGNLEPGEAYTLALSALHESLRRDYCRGFPIMEHRA